MPDLEQQISNWRAQMLAAGIQSPATLDELESHLREDIAQQTKSGIDVKTAFEAAVQKIGKASALTSEFNKNHRPTTILGTLMVTVCILVVAFGAFLAGVTVFLCYSNWTDRLMAAIPMACTILVACSWTRVVPHLPTITGVRKRNTIGLACVAFGFVFANIFAVFILPHFEVGPDRQIHAVGFWLGFIVAFFACLGLGLAMDDRAREPFEAKKSPRRQAAVN
jgi:hypothetical protein